jgi:hypothetical protein
MFEKLAIQSHTIFAFLNLSGNIFIKISNL